MVVFSHLINNFAAQAAPALNKPYLLFITDGSLAVYVFFVVSGFALSTGFFDRQGTSIIRSLALRRYPRLTIPIAASVLMGAGLMYFGLLHNKQAGALAHSERWLATFYDFAPSLWGAVRFAAFDVYFRYNEVNTYNAVLWTMSVELWGSILVFSLLAIFGKVNRTIPYAAILLVSVLLNSPMTAFVLGVILAEWFHDSKPSKRMAPIFIAAGACVIVFSTFGRQYYDATTQSIAAFVLVGSIVWIMPLRDFFQNRVSRWLGKLSFPLYLTHIHVIASFSSAIFLAMLDRGMSLQAASNIMVAASLPVMVVVAIAFSPIEGLSIRAARAFSTLALTRLSTSRQEYS